MGENPKRGNEKQAMKKHIAIIVISVFILLLLSSCSDNENKNDEYPNYFTTGNYYLDGDTGNACIQIINYNTMRFINFDIDYLAYYLVAEGTDYTGKEIEDFMERHNLPDVFNEVIEFEFNEEDNNIYVKALSNSNETNDAFTVNYRMKYENKDTISFMEKVYIRCDITQSV